jgi:mono/diheme cytochrome c family protein
LAAARDHVESSPSVFLPAGPFESEIKGTIKIPLSGSYEFRLEGTGEIEVNIRGENISNSAERTQGSEAIRLQKGHNPVNVRYRSPKRGIAEWKLWWKGHDFDWEPVPPDALFYDSGTEEQQSAAKRRLGRQLVATHRCVQCHRTELGSSPMFETTLTAPDLAELATRLNPEWIEQWLIEPASLHPHPSMPALLPKNAPEHAANIAAFLTAGNSAATSSDTPPSDRLAKDGEAMFGSFGCITCHHFDQEESSSRNDRLSLHFAAAKYLDGAIAKFLLNPTQHHTASRMPNFALSAQQASALAAYIRSASRGRLTPSGRTGDLAAGITAVATFGCQHCHAIGSGSPMLSAKRPWRLDALEDGCLANPASTSDKVPNRDQTNLDQPAIPAPRFTWSDTERAAIRDFVSTSLESMQTTHPAETSQRLVKTLRCSACHDRDGVRSPRPLIIAEEGSGRLPEVIPSLTLLGEKFHADWNRRLFSGTLEQKPRPWLTARMPAFPAYADALATGLAIEHAIDPQSPIDHSFDPKLAAIGEQLTLETGLDCRQCHAIGDLQPRGDQKTQIALGINFDMIRDRIRRPAYHRFMLDPPRYDINTKMIKLSENGITTKLKSIYDQDAKKQFEAVWHYMQSLEN